VSLARSQVDPKPHRSSGKSFPLHPACQIIPERDDEEVRTLADDIKRHGLRCPVVVYQGKVLDGRARLAACELAGVEASFSKWCGEGSPIEWCIVTNLLFHDLTYSQRVVLARDVLSLLEKETDDQGRNGEGGGVGRSENGGPAETAARITRTSVHHIRAVRLIEARRPTLLEAVRCGELALSGAKRRARISWRDGLPPRRRNGSWQTGFGRACHEHWP
jgi:hypothetical protein